MINKIRNNLKAITLIELLIAMALSAVVAGTIIAIVLTGSRISKFSQYRLGAFQTTQVTLDRIAHELKEAVKIYGAEAHRIAFYKQGYSLAPYAGPPLPKGEEYKQFDIVVYTYYTEPNKPGVVKRTVWDGEQPTKVLSPPTIISDPNTDITNLRFTYFNYMTSWDYERLPFDAYPPGGPLTPFVRTVPARIGPAYPQNIWRRIAWLEEPKPLPPSPPDGRDLTLQTRFCYNNALADPLTYFKVWFDDKLPDGNPFPADNTASLPAVNPWSGERCIKVKGTFALDTWEENREGFLDCLENCPWFDFLCYLDCIIAWFGGEFPRIKIYNQPALANNEPLPQPDGDSYDILFAGDIPSGFEQEIPLGGVIDLTKEPDTPNGSQIEVIVGGGGNIYGKVKLKGTGRGPYDPPAVTNDIIEEVEVYDVGQPATSTNIFKTLTNLYVSGFPAGYDTDGNPNTLEEQFRITLINPNKKCFIFIPVKLEWDPISPVKELLISFHIQGAGDNEKAWVHSHWSATEDRKTYYIHRGVPGVNRMWRGPLPKPGRWTLLSIPVAQPIARDNPKKLQEGVDKFDGIEVAVYPPVENTEVYIDKIAIGRFSKWTGTGGADTAYTDAGGENIKDIAGNEYPYNIKAQYIQYKANFYGSSPTPPEHPQSEKTPLLDESVIHHDKVGSSRWVLTTTDEFYTTHGLNNTLIREGAVELWRLSKDENLTQAEEGPIQITPPLEDTSYTDQNIWDQITWTRGADVWLWGAWLYRRRIDLVNTSGIDRILEPVEVVLNLPNAKPDGADIRITTANGIEKPYTLLNTANPFRIVFLGSVKAGTPDAPRRTTYWVYYGNPTAIAPNYRAIYNPDGSPASVFIAWPKGRGPVGHYYTYFVPRCSQFPGFPPCTPDPYYPWYPDNSQKGRFEGQRLDYTLGANGQDDSRVVSTADDDEAINFNWGRTAPGVGSAEQDYFSISWRGYIYLEPDPSDANNHTWRFKLDTNNWGRVYLDGALVSQYNNKIGTREIDLDPPVALPGWEREWQIDTADGTIAFIKRGLHKLQVDFAEYSDSASAQLYYECTDDLGPATPLKLVPRRNIYGYYTKIIGDAAEKPRFFYEQSNPDNWGVEVGDEQTRGEIPIVGEIYISAQGSQTGENGTWVTVLPFTPIDGNITLTQPINNATYRYLRYIAKLELGADKFRSPLLDEVQVHNAISGIWTVQTRQDDFEAGAANDTDPRRIPGAVSLIADPTQQALTKPEIVDIERKKDITPAIWDKIMWQLGDQEWPLFYLIGAEVVSPYYRRKVTFEERDGQPRRNEPVVIDIPNDGNIQADCKDIRVTDALGREKAYEIISASATSCKILFVASCRAGSPTKPGQSSYYIYYHPVKSPFTDPTLVVNDPGKTYTKTTPIKWPNGNGLIGTYFRNKRVYGTGDTQNGTAESNGPPRDIIRHDYWIEQRRDSQLNFPMDWNTPPGNDEGDYFAVQWNGYIYTAVDGNYTIKAEHAEHLNLKVDANANNVLGEAADVNISSKFENCNYHQETHWQWWPPGWVTRWVCSPINYNWVTSQQTQSFTNRMHKVQIDIDNYVGGAQMVLKGVGSGGVAADVVIPSTELYPRYGNADGNRVYGSGAEALDKYYTIGPVEEHKYKPVTDGEVRLYTRVAEEQPVPYPGAGDWQPVNFGSDYGLADPNTGRGEATLTDRNKRYIQTKISLTTANTNVTPVLAFMAIHNKQSDRWYPIGVAGGGQADWEAADYINNVDTTALPGNILLKPSVGDNVARKIEEIDAGVEKSTYYAGTIWTKIKWERSYEDWPGINRMYRRQITIQEPGLFDRFYEPVVVRVDVGDPAKVRDDGCDVYVTTPTGLEVPFDFRNYNGADGRPGTGSVFYLYLLVTVARGSSATYFVYYGDPYEGCGQPGPYYSKFTTPRFPDGSGVVRRRWNNSAGANNGTIDHSNYAGRTLVNNISAPNIGDYFTYRFDGWVYTSGSNYTFRRSVDDHIRVWVNNVLRHEGFWGGTADFAAGNNAGFNRLTVEMGDYAWDAYIDLRGVNVGGSANINSIIPQSELYPVWTQSQTDLNVISANYFRCPNGVLPHDLAANCVGAEQPRPDQSGIPIVFGTLAFATRGSHDGITWSGWSTEITDPPNQSQQEYDISCNYRFVQLRNRLIAPLPPDRTPVLASAHVYNAATGRWYTTTARADFANNVDNNNVDWDIRPGDLFLKVNPNATDIVHQVQTNDTTVGRSTYWPGNIWTRIRWRRGFEDWAGGNRTRRRRIQVCEPNVVDRFNEPIVVQVNVGNEALVRNDGCDVLLTTSTGAEIPFDFKQENGADGRPGTGTTFYLLFLVNLLRNTCNNYYVYYNDPNEACGQPGPYYSKTTNPGFGDGAGVVRRYWRCHYDNQDGNIAHDWYQNRTLVNNIDYPTSPNIGDYFTYRFDGWVYTSGANYQFDDCADDHIDVWINGTHRHTHRGADCHNNWAAGNNAGFNRLTVDFGEYSGGAGVYLHGVTTGGGPSDTQIIPQSELYPVWTQNVHDLNVTARNYLNYQVFDEEQATLYTVPYGQIRFATRGSNNLTTWTNWSDEANLSDPPQGNNVEYDIVSGAAFRYLQVRPQMYAPTPPDHTPVLDEFHIYNAAAARWYSVTTEDDFANNSGNSNVDWTIRPGALFLSVGASSDFLQPIETQSITQSWSATNANWLGGTRTQRLLARVCEEASIDRSAGWGEPIEIQFPTNSVRADGDDILLTTAAGTVLPHQFQAGVANVWARILFLFDVGPSQCNNYYIYFGGGGAYEPPPYTKNTTPAWPAGIGIVRAGCGYDPGGSAQHGLNCGPIWTGGELHQSQFSAGDYGEYFSDSWRGWVYTGGANYNLRMVHDDGGRLWTGNTHNALTLRHDHYGVGDCWNIPAANPPRIWAIRAQRGEYVGGSVIQVLGVTNDADATNNQNVIIPQQHLYPHWCDYGCLNNNFYCNSGCISREYGRNFYITLPVRRAQLFFNELFLRDNALIRIYNRDQDLANDGIEDGDNNSLLWERNIQGFWSGWTGWLGANTAGTPVTSMNGLRLRIYVYYTDSNVGPFTRYNVTQYQYEKLAYDEDGAYLQVPYWAIDNDTTSHWEGGVAYPQTLVIHFGRQRRVNRYRWKPDISGPYRFRVDLSPDGSNWFKVSTDINGVDPELTAISPNAGSYFDDSFPPMEAQMIKIRLIDGPPNGQRIDDVDVFPVTYNTPGYLIKQFPVEREVDIKYLNIYAREVRLHFDRLRLHGHASDPNRDQLLIYNNRTGAHLLTISAPIDSNNYWTGWLPAIPVTDRHGLQLRIELHYAYNNIANSGYNIDRYEYRMLAVDEDGTFTANAEPWRAIDNGTGECSGDETTYWEGGGALPQTLIIHLGRERRLNRYRFRPHAYGEYKFRVEVSPDYANWYKVSEDINGVDPELVAILPNAGNYFDDSFPTMAAVALRIRLIQGPDDRISNVCIYPTTYQTEGYLTVQEPRVLEIDSKQLPIPARDVNLHFSSLHLIGNTAAIQSPAIGTRISTLSKSGKVLGGVVATDGKYLYVKRWGTYDGPTNFNIIGSGFAETAEGSDYGDLTSAGATNTLSAFYLNGYVYNGYTSNGWNLARTRVIDNTTSYLSLSGKPLMDRGTGNDLAAASSNILVTTDGLYIYNLAHPGNTSFKVRIFDREGNFVKEYTVAGGFYANGLLADGVYVYAIQWKGNVKRWDAFTGLNATQWAFTNNDGDMINGQYDYYNGVFWLGHINADYLRVYRAATASVDQLRIINNDTGEIIRVYTAPLDTNDLWTGWLFDNKPSTNEWGVRLRIELRFAYNKQSDAGYKIDKYQWKKLAYIDDSINPDDEPATHPAWHAIDDAGDTTYAQFGPYTDLTGNRELVVDLGIVKSINRLLVKFVDPGVYKYEIATSIDGGDYGNTIVDRLDNTDPMPAAGYEHFIRETKCRFVKIIVISTPRADGQILLSDFQINETKYTTPGELVTYKVPSITGGNIIADKNPGFEKNTSGEAPTDWSYGGNCDITRCPVTSQSRTGQSAFVFNSSAGGPNLYLNSTDFIPIDAKNEYYLSGWIKTEGATKAELGIEWYDGTLAQIKRDWITWGTSASGVWQYHEGVYKPPSNATSAKVFFARWAETAGKAYYDDIRFGVADFLYDTQYIREAARDIRLHFAYLYLRRTKNIRGDERLQDRLWIYDDSTSELLAEFYPHPDIDNAVIYHRLKPTPATTTINPAADFWTHPALPEGFGTGDLRIVLRYNYTSIIPSGYLIDKYEYYIGAEACHYNGDNRPSKAIDMNDTTYWEHDQPTVAHSPWFEIDMGRIASIGRLELKLQNRNYKYYIEISQDGEVFKRVVDEAWRTGPDITHQMFAGGAVIVGNKEAAATLSPENQPPANGALLSVSVYGGAQNTGSVTISGTTLEDGAGSSETITFDGSATRMTSKHFTAVTSITTANLADESPIPYITIGAVSKVDAQFIRIVFTGVSGGDGKIRLYEFKIYQNPYRSPGTLDSETLPPRREPSSGAILAGVWGSYNDWSYNTEGNINNWTLYNMSAPTVTQGVLVTSATTTDPYMVSEDNLNIDISSPIYSTSDYSKARYIQINMRVSGGTKGKVYFTTDIDPVFNEFKSKEFNLITDNKFHTYCLRMIDVGADYEILPARRVQPELEPINQPPSATKLLITLSGNTAGTGTVTIYGEDATDSPITETLTFSGLGTIETTQAFKRITRIRTTGLAEELIIDTDNLNLTIATRPWASRLKRLRVDPVDTDAAAGQVYEIDSIRVLPKTSDQQESIVYFNQPGAGFLNLHFTKFKDIIDDDMIHIYAEGQTPGLYNVHLMTLNAYSFTETGAWTGNLGWGYNKLAIKFVFNPNAKNPGDLTGNGVPDNYVIPEFKRSHRFYSSSRYQNNNPLFGAFRAADGIESQPSACSGACPGAPPIQNCPYYYWRSEATNPTNPEPLNWTGVAPNQHGWFVDLVGDDGPPAYNELGEVPYVNKMVIKWRTNCVQPGDFRIMWAPSTAGQPLPNAADWRPVYIVGGGGDTYIFASEKARYIGIFPTVDAENPDRIVELAEVYIYPAGDYVGYGTYLSKPFSAAAHNTWILPYPTDCYDCRLHFERFETQKAVASDMPSNDNDIIRYSDTFRIYNNNTSALIYRLYGAWNEGSPPLIAEGGSTDPNKISDYGTGYRTRWLIAGNDGPIPSTVDPATLGTRFKLLFTPPLGYEIVDGFTIDRYQLYCVVNPTMVQIDIAATRGKGKARREVNLTTKVQPPNLLYR